MGMFDFLTKRVKPEIKPAGSVPLHEVAFNASRWTPPKRPQERKGKRKTPEEREAERVNLAAHMRELAEKRIARDFARAQSIGITHYIWRACGANTDSCAVCLSLHGQKFRLDTRPSHGHPGQPVCAERGYCRCSAEMIIPNFN